MKNLNDLFFLSFFTHTFFFFSWFMPVDIPFFAGFMSPLIFFTTPVCHLMDTYRHALSRSF